MRLSFYGVALAAALAGATSARLARSRRRVRRRRPSVPQPARVAAPIDMTGTWASVINEDWQWRFVTPIVGDYTGVPLNADGDRLARQWNPDADAKAGQQCKGFGAAAINRLPTRMQISWVDDNTMKLDFDPRHPVAPRLLRQDESGGGAQPAGARHRRVDRSARARAAGGPVGQAPPAHGWRTTSGRRCRLRRRVGAGAPAAWRGAAAEREARPRGPRPAD
jgi:hypothetical protein